MFLLCTAPFTQNQIVQKIKSQAVSLCFMVFSLAASQKSRSAIYSCLQRRNGNSIWFKDAEMKSFL